MKTKIQYLKQEDGSIVKFNAQLFVNDKGDVVQVLHVEGKEVSENAYKAQEVKREKEKLVAQEEAIKVFKVKQSNKASALAKLAKVAGLTDEELAALQ